MSQEFVAFARACGVEIADLDSGDRIRRCGTTAHPRSKNGAYRWDGRSGWVWAWDGEGRAIRFDDPHAKPADRATLERQKQRRRERMGEEMRLHAVAAEKAQAMLERTKATTHGYLERKGLKDVRGLVMPDGELFVPMRDVLSNELLGAQLIRWLPVPREWEKKYLWGMRSGGAVLRLGGRTFSETILCEGYATGLSIEIAARHMHLDAAVVVTFSDHNLVRVAHALKDRGRCYVVADHDPPQRDPEKAKQNPGEQGQRAAAATGLGWAMSATEGHDANDEHVSRGLPALCALVMRARAASA